MAKAKTINLLLNDGTLKGVLSMEDSSWYKGELWSAPRDSVDALISTDACTRYGVYLLLSEDKVYVGQASDLSKRIKQHILGKTWWERVVILTTSDDSLNRADLDYIEACLISKASYTGRLDCDNKNMGNKQKLSRYRQVEIEQYLEEALFLLELIGINVFQEPKIKNQGRKEPSLISSVVNSSDKQLEIRAKKDAIQFLCENGYVIEKNVNYAKCQENKPEFWLNPNITALDKDWDLILNNQFDVEIILIHIPACEFQVGSQGKKVLFTRHDLTHRIDLNIDAHTFIDRRSKCSFSPYIVQRIKY